MPQPTELAVQYFLRNHGTRADLETLYGVYSKAHPRYPNLIQFTYDQIESSSKKSEQIVRECRGLILDSSDNWAVVARPFSRFFNLNEGCADKIDWPSSRVQEKVDGSLCIVYHYAGRWHVATKGMPDAGGEVNGCGFTFAELFWKVADAQGVSEWLAADAALIAGGAPTPTYLFELTSPYNKVVVAHRESKLTLIGIRDNRSGNETNLSYLRDHFEQGGLNPVKEYSFSSMEEMAAFAKDINGTEGEGFVVVDGYFNRVKVKSDNYLALSHMKEGFGPRRVLEVIRTGEASEVLAYVDAFPEWASMFKDVSERFEGLVAEVEADYERLKGIEDQKAFALEAVKTRASGALFNLRNGKATNVRRYLAEMNEKSLMGILKIADIVVDFRVAA